MEKWDAYTREGVLTDAVLVRGEPIPEGLYHLVCDVLVRHADGSYLCMKRALSKEAYAGFYEATAGGSALRGEDAHACGKRELKEETGIDCDELEEIDRIVYDDDHCIFYSFLCTVDCDKDSVRLQEGETEDYVWMSEKEFIAFVNSDKMIAPQKRRYMKYLKKLGYV